MRTHPIALAAGLALLVGSIAASPTTTPATTRSSRPVVSLITGAFHGTVIDDEQLVPCATTFTVKDLKVVGTYAVREGAERYLGTLDRYELVSEERRECRFHWKDQHGEGLVTFTVSPDGETIAGSWGLEVVQERLTWRGERQPTPAPRPKLR